MRLVKNRALDEPSLNQVICAKNVVALSCAVAVVVAGTRALDEATGFLTESVMGEAAAETAAEAATVPLLTGAVVAGCADVDGMACKSEFGELAALEVEFDEEAEDEVLPESLSLGFERNCEEPTSSQ